MARAMLGIEPLIAALTALEFERDEERRAGEAAALKRPQNEPLGNHRLRLVVRRVADNRETATAQRLRPRFADEKVRSKERMTAGPKAVLNIRADGQMPAPPRGVKDGPAPA